MFRKALWKGNLTWLYRIAPHNDCTGRKGWMIHMVCGTKTREQGWESGMDTEDLWHLGTTPRSLCQARVLALKRAVLIREEGCCLFCGWRYCPASAIIRPFIRASCIQNGGELNNHTCFPHSFAPFFQGSAAFLVHRSFTCVFLGNLFSQFPSSLLHNNISHVSFNGCVVQDPVHLSLPWFAGLLPYNDWQTGHRLLPFYDLSLGKLSILIKHRCKVKV